MNVKYSFCLIVFLFLSSIAIAQTQSEEVSLVACGYAASSEEADKNANRAGLEQVCRVFIENGIELTRNFELFQKILSEENSIIKSAEPIYSAQLTVQRFVVVKKILISFEKLKSALISAGVTNSVEANQFTYEIKKQLLTEQNEIKVVGDLVGLLHEPMQTIFDFQIISGSPSSVDAESKKWKIPLTVVAKTNQIIDSCANFFIKVMGALSMSEEEANKVATAGKSYFPLIITYLNREYRYYLRKDITCRALISFQKNWELYTRLFAVNSGIDISYGNGNLWGYTKLYMNSYETDSDEGEQLYKFDGSNIWYNDIKWVGFNFLTKDQNAAIFKWDDMRDMEQIQKMSGFSIQPLGIVSPFVRGGYLIAQTGDRGIVASVYDLGTLNWDDAKKACRDLTIGGYSGWDLPNETEFAMMNKVLFRTGIIGFRPEGYWINVESNGVSNTTCVSKPATKRSPAYICPYGVLGGLGWGFTEIRTKDGTNHVRPVRRF